MTLIALMAAMCMVSCVFLGTDVSSAEEAVVPEVEENDQVEIELNGEKTEVDSFRYMGVIYAVTCTDESAQTVGVYGTYDETGRTIPDHMSLVVCGFSVGEEDDEVAYAVTSVLGEFKDNYVATTVLALSETVTEFADDCFETLSPSSVLVVADPEYEGDDLEDDQRAAYVAELKASTKYAGTLVCASDVDAALMKTVTFECGDMNDNIKQHYNKDFADDGYTYTRDFVPLMTVVGCDFERPGFAMETWTDGSDGEIGAESQVICLDGRLFVDGEEYDGGYTLTAQWEEEKDYLADFEIEIKVPGYTICTISGTYEMWMMWATVGIIIVLAVIGLSAFGYRTAVARRS